MLPAVFSGCTQNDILYDVDYNVTFDPSNTYLAGDPVKFNFTGEVDNILFYSGETGSEYQYRDRYTIPVEEVTKATLRLDVISRYGSYAGGLDVYYTDKFSGLDRNDPEADRATIASMSGDMAAAGWIKPVIMNMAVTLPHTSLRRPIPPPSPEAMVATVSSSSPSTSLYASNTAWQQLYPRLLKFSLARATLSSTLKSAGRDFIFSLFDVIIVEISGFRGCKFS